MFYKFLVKYSDGDQKYFIIASSMNIIDKDFIELTKDIPIRYVIPTYYPIFLSDAWEEVARIASKEVDNDCKKQDVSTIYFIN